MTVGQRNPAGDGPAEDATSPASHLHLAIEGQHPDAVAFQFERGRKRMPGAAAFSVAAHIAALSAIVLGVHYHTPATTPQAVTPLPSAPTIVWLGADGPGGGGGGGGNGAKAPARRVEMPGHDAMTVPVQKRPPLVLSVQATPHEEAPAPAIPQLDIDALTMARGLEPAVGTLDGVTGGTSRGPGNGPGAGDGRGRGIGADEGDGLDAGYGRNTGGRQYQPGNGVDDPEPVYTPSPLYTAAAMQARVEGTAVVECVVRVDGTVGDAHIVRSLDSRFGLDAEAVRAASKWRFVPARRRGQPVPVLVAIEVTFSLR